MNDRIEALRRAVEASPADVSLRLLLAETLLQADRHQDALTEYEILLGSRSLPGDEALNAGNLALELSRVDLAKGFLEAARSAGMVQGVGSLEQRIEEALRDRGIPMVPLTPELTEPSSPWVKDIETITFDAVGGLEETKKAIHRMVILPLSRPELYERYGRRTGGGILLYGPPGCGKTMLARATAGESGLPFVNVRIEEILDPFMGMSERNLHSAFDFARSSAPCVLFLDELDALGFARSKQATSAARSLVDLLLQEMDSIGAENDQILILAATNAPWDVDEALLRPGRFDRRMFVPPPDEKARQAILHIHTSAIPNSSLDTGRLARATEMFSGADIRALVDAAVDQVIDEALESGGEPPVEGKHLERALHQISPTTLEWLQRAKNYVEFANQGGRYADVAEYLERRDVRRMLGRR